jgi:phosphoribosyl-AMP cyclohydrolase / phosphoribosyl-ATP pyrophosphohydrolase
MSINIDEVKFDSQGLVPAIVQDASSGAVLTLAWMNRESLQLTVENRETWFWSRSRQKLWRKGETSGNTQKVVDIHLDCDLDAILLSVEVAGPACHTGAVTCFHNPSGEENSRGPVLEELYKLLQHRKVERPEGSYTTYLFNEGIDKILKKVGEEAAETIIAAKNQEAARLVSETADLIYHLLVMLVEKNVSLEMVMDELRRRRGKVTLRD